MNKWTWVIKSIANMDIEDEDKQRGITLATAIKKKLKEHDLDKDVDYFTKCIPKYKYGNIPHTIEVVSETEYCSACVEYNSKCLECPLSNYKAHCMPELFEFDNWIDDMRKQYYLKLQKEEEELEALEEKY